MSKPAYFQYVNKPWEVRDCVLLLCAGPTVELVRLSVRPKYRRKGHGTACIRRLQEHGMRITVNPSADDMGGQSDLERFYSRLGFRPVHPDCDTWEWVPKKKHSKNKQLVLTGR